MLRPSLTRRSELRVTGARVVSLALTMLVVSGLPVAADEQRWSGWYVGATGLSQEIDDDRLDGYGFYFGWGFESKNSKRNLAVSHEVGLGIDDTGTSTLLWTSSTLGWQTNGIVLYTDAGVSLYSWYGFPVGASVDLGVGMEFPVSSTVSLRAEYSREIADDQPDVSLGRAGIGLTYRF